MKKNSKYMLDSYIYVNDYYKVLYNCSDWKMVIFVLLCVISMNHC